ncbi:hypothetical protein NUW54_g10352 [Trametes sanguinea]|uniref:Uncharacterized protein n=1 Tax=Trametes sanguinea TaxID=158606 RepID=A0ACC1NZU7_9APHY|nr:hypothetical protein NUW54_g10352 [Trametes sanguinea]
MGYVPRRTNASCPSIETITNGEHAGLFKESKRAHSRTEMRKPSMHPTMSIQTDAFGHGVQTKIRKRIRSARARPEDFSEAREPLVEREQDKGKYLSSRTSKSRIPTSKAHSALFSIWTSEFRRLPVKNPRAPGFQRYFCVPARGELMEILAKKGRPVGAPLAALEALILRVSRAFCEPCPNELSFRDASIINAVLGAGGPHRGPHLAGRSLSITDKPWIRAFSLAALKEYEPMIAHRVNQLVHVLEKQPGEVIMGKFFNYFVYDFIFGGGSELLRGGDKDNIWHIIEDGLPGCTFLSHVPYLGVYCGRLPILRPAVDHLRSYSMKLVRERLERSSKVKDIFHYLASLLQTTSKNDEGQPDKPAPPVQYLLNEGSLAVLAGSDTTSSALTSLIFCLLTHPAALKRLQSEVDLFYPREDDPCDPKHHREMHFLDTLRDHASLSSASVWQPTSSLSSEERRHAWALLCSRGTMMFLPPYILHRDPRNFSPFPDDFWPERWLVAAGRTSLSDALAHAPADVTEADKQQSFVHNDTAFIPFLHGPANCVGKQLAMQEMRTVVSALIQKFDFSLRPDWDVKEYDKGFKDYYVTTRPDVPVVLRPRF